ncbi:hypothetical protein PoB_001199800 [Plakobranchus ocellatus]|uniref:Uncharacterized protein n=1 Tax=Plakobranchus ocellatus TaxID=259542 RepID=A0AAV3YTA7_9GAST|nr:hypothetical protein PoB_001199800 [Plakobranchus ocellatus]
MLLKKWACRDKMDSGRFHETSYHQDSSSKSAAKAIATTKRGAEEQPPVIRTSRALIRVQLRQGIRSYLPVVRENYR